MGWQRSKRGPTYLRMLAGIITLYALMIGFNTTVVGGPGRIVLLGYLVWMSLRLRGLRSLKVWVWIVTPAAVALTVGVGLGASERVASAVVGGLSFITIGVVIAIIATTVVGFGRVDTPTVLGVLCIYLLLAMLFATLNQFLAAFSDGYLNGVTGLPTSSDQLYFSVITLATVGFGDITPASEIARAVTVVEALVGQLYLVSVVAGVVGSWRRGEPPTPLSDQA